MKNTKNLNAESEEGVLHPSQRPAATLLRSLGKRIAKGRAAFIPVFVAGSWSLQVSRGNKRILQLKVPH